MAESGSPPASMEVVVLSVSVKATLGVMVRDEQGLRCVRTAEEKSVVLFAPHAEQLAAYLRERVSRREKELRLLSEK